MGVYIDGLNKFKDVLNGLPDEVTWEDLDDAFYDVSVVPAIRKDITALIYRLFPGGRWGSDKVTTLVVAAELDAMIAHELSVASNTENSIPAEVLWRIRAEAINDAASAVDAYHSDAYRSREGNYLRDVADSASKGLL